MNHVSSGAGQVGKLPEGNDLSTFPELRETCLETVELDSSACGIYTWNSQAELVGQLVRHSLQHPTGVEP